jgi:hypothetical protein
VCSRHIEMSRWHNWHDCFARKCIWVRLTRKLLHVRLSAQFLIVIHIAFQFPSSRCPTSHLLLLTSPSSPPPSSRWHSLTPLPHRTIEPPLAAPSLLKASIADDDKPLKSNSTLKIPPPPSTLICRWTQHVPLCLLHRSLQSDSPNSSLHVAGVAC